MMRRAASILLSVLVLIVLAFLCSCELSMQAPHRGKVHILVYGNDYLATPSLKYLSATVDDAVQVGKALAALCEKQGMVKDVDYDVMFIFGSAAHPEYDDIPASDRSNDVTGTRLLGELDRIAGISEGGDMTFLYLSGHGDSEYKSKVEYGTDTASKACFATKKYYDSQSKAYELVPVSTLMEHVEAIRGSKVVFSDFCYSGAFVQAGYVTVTGSEYKELTALELYALRSEIRESPSSFYLSASRYYEISEESGAIGHGYFTMALLDALGWDEDSGTIIPGGVRKNGTISFFDVANYVMRNDEAPQTPMYSGGSNDIILFSF